MAMRRSVGMCLLASLAGLLAATATAAAPNRAGLVITFGDGSTETRCVEFGEPEISGIELLERSGLSLVKWGTGAGAAVCKIDGEGCDNPNNCFCECSGADCRYWAYYTLEDGAWQYAQAGASRRRVHDGDVDGWAWGVGSATGGATPSLLTFDDICPPVAPTAEPPPTSAPPQPLPTTGAPPQPDTVPHPAATGEAPPLTGGPGVTPTLQPATPAPTERTATARPRSPAEPTPMAVESDAGDDDDGFPRQMIAFAGVAAALVGTAAILTWRRSRG